MPVPFPCRSGLRHGLSVSVGVALWPCLLRLVGDNRMRPLGALSDQLRPPHSVDEEVVAHLVVRALIVRDHTRDGVAQADLSRASGPVDLRDERLSSRSAATPHRGNEDLDAPSAGMTPPDAVTLP